MEPEQLLLRGDKPVPLTPKAFDTLVVLVRHNKEVVSKDELMKAVWPDTFVEEVSFTRNIFMLRRALGDTLQDHRCIVTLPGKGYRFGETVRLVREQEVNLVAVHHAKLQVQVEETSSRPWSLPLPVARSLCLQQSPSL